MANDELLSEWEFAQRLQKFCKVIALGKSTEKLPPLGFNRIYVQNNIWQDTFIKLISKSDLVCVFIGKNFTNGLIWELKYLKQNFNPDQIVFYFKPKNSLARRKCKFCGY